MNITQEKPEFKPITITLDSKDEGEALWRAVRVGMPVASGNERKLLIRISDWFSTEANL